MQGSYFLKRAAKKAKKVAKKVGTWSQAGKDEALNSAGASSSKIALKSAINHFGDTDRDKIWAFFAGQRSNSFRGNPKYLFIYINKYRPDIKAYWLSDDPDTIQQVRDCGFIAYESNTSEAQYAMERTGVIVAEQVKASIPDGFHDIKYLNLWHGNGFKHVERKLYDGDLAFGLAKKYIDVGSFYRENQLVLATSETNEPLIRSDLGVDEDKIIRSGYPRCLYQSNFERFSSFDHNLRRIKGLPETTRMAVYAPTYRAEMGNTFCEAIPDLEKLHDVCEKNGILLVFKVHPNMEEEVGFLKAWQTYGDMPYFWFWDNIDDFYEIMDQMDLAIIDYSAIFADMLAMDITHFIRYVYDIDEYMVEGFTQGKETYYATTLGTVCRDFNSLLNSISSFEDNDCSQECEALKEELWGYSNGASDFEAIIARTLDFEPSKRTGRTLYSFDVFDTLISRKVLDPKGIYYYVQEKIQEHGGYPFMFGKSYPEIRHTAEYNVREYYRKSRDLRQSEKVEIHFDEIFDRIGEVHGLNAGQLEQLKRWELEAEFENVIPIQEKIDLVKQLVSEGNDVVLISDMYLPSNVILEMLAKVDRSLAELPLYLSNEYGVLKTSCGLFREVYRTCEPFYDYDKWIHCGDNKNADQVQPRKLSIVARKVESPVFGDYQQEMISKLGTYDAHLVAAVQARMNQSALSDKERFVIEFVALCMVPYIDWAIRDALKRGYQTLYFVSRDGHHLKRIADAIISAKQLPLKTKYIYASRRLWRIPSYINEIDQGFWQNYGNFVQVPSKEKLFSAMDLDEDRFRSIFPTIDPDAIDFTNREEFDSLVNLFRMSKAYEDYLLKKAAEERVLSGGYLLQEIDPNEKFAFVEYWGRGYNQDCLVRLWRDATGDSSAEVPFYYSRSILPSQDGSIRHDFTTNNSSQFFIEALFANMPYKSVDKYEIVDGRIEPAIVPIDFDKRLFKAEEIILPAFAREFAMLPLRYPEDTDRMLYDFVFEYFTSNRDNPSFANQIGTLVDSISLYGKKREFAPPFTKEHLEAFREKTLSRSSGMVTTSITMSAIRTSEEVLQEYRELFQILPGEDLAGGRLLSDEEIEKNRYYRELYDEQVVMCSSFKQAYQEACSTTSVDGSVVIVTNGKTLAGVTLTSVRDGLKARGIDPVVLCMKTVESKTKIDAAARQLAKSKCIVAAEPIKNLALVDFRLESSFILLRPDAFNLYMKCNTIRYSLSWQQKYYDFVSVNDVSIMQIPSAYQEQRFKRNFATNSGVDCSLFGNINTDIYFKGLDDECRAQLEKLFPSAVGKKVILYIPSIRLRRDSEQWAELFDMRRLKELIGSEYVVVVNAQKKDLMIHDNPVEIEGFSKVIQDGQMNMRRLLIAADVVVGDYRDRFFESAIVRKPTYSTAFDFERLLARDPRLNCDSPDLFIPGPVVCSSEGLAEELGKISEYDYSKLDEVRTKLYEYCDGKSADRVVEKVISILQSGGQ